MTRDRYARVQANAIEDRRIGHAAFRVYCCLASFADKDGMCWPSTRKIASHLGMARSTVFEHLQALATLGYLTIDGSSREDGGRAANRYRIAARPANGEAPDFALTPVGPADTPLSDQPTTPAGWPGYPPAGSGPAGIKNRPIRTDQRTLSAHSASSRPASQPRAPKKFPGYAAEFETFWRVYPSRRPHPNPKEPAALKFAAALKLGVDPAVIIAGAGRYAAYVAREVQDPRFIVQAATWLHQKRWNDQHEAAEPPRLRVGMN